MQCLSTYHGAGQDGLMQAYRATTSESAVLTCKTLLPQALEPHIESAANNHNQQDYQNMTLGEYVDLICQKCRRTDNPTRDEARTYIRNKYRTIYESKPWRDVSGVVGVPISTEQVTILPQIIDRVISCRWSNTITIPNASLYEIMEINPHRFDEVGDPLSFSIISPSGVAVPPLGQKIRATTSGSTPEFKMSLHGAYNGDKVSEIINMTGNATVESS